LKKKGLSKNQIWIRPKSTRGKSRLHVIYGLQG